MRTTILIAALILCLASPAATQKDSIPKKKLYKAWLKLNTDPVKQKGVLFEIQDSSVVLSDAKNLADYIDGKFTVSQFKVSSIENIKIRRKRNINRGALIGMAAGFVAGGIAGAFLGQGNAGAILWVGCWGLGLGAAVGAAIGSVKISIPIHGDQVKFNERRKKLMTYAFNNHYIIVPPAHFIRLHSNVADTDGNVYHTLALAGQVWMASNLKVTHYRNGDPITKVKAGGDWGKAATGATCYYVNDSSANNNLGNLYNWNAINDTRGLCPKGWHVPSLSEWSSLLTCLGGESEAGKKITEPIPAVTGSLSEDPFALPGGFRYNSGEFSSKKGLSYQWWSATSVDTAEAKAFYMGNDDGGIMFTNSDNRSGLPVRCLRD